MRVLVEGYSLQGGKGESRKSQEKLSGVYSDVHVNECCNSGHGVMDGGKGKDPVDEVMTRMVVGH